MPVSSPKNEVIVSSKIASYHFKMFILTLFLFLSGASAHALENGLSHDLAIKRTNQVHDLSYSLHFKIPEDEKGKIIGEDEIQFNLKNLKEPVIVDFKGEGKDVSSATVNGNKVEVLVDHEHLVFKDQLKIGKNSIVIHYETLPASLHRSPEFVYTLLVPDRASQLFPCFDQPDLKAKFTLSLDMPASWIAVGNESILHSSVDQERTRVDFAQTPLMSTYLFAFAAGKWKTITDSRAGREMTLYYRENDQTKVDLNRADIFDLHAGAVSELEKYTGIPYPNSKLDFVLVPSFPYGGMEHPGAIFYKEESLFLDATASTQQRISRATTISHEVAHQWFGNLVTMKWFEDVWLKEVMANFFADKIIDPLFPKFDHGLKFYSQHFPGAYAIDRSGGANAIHQNLDNLENAGSLYGGIIYLKAPILMNQLEKLMGIASFQKGIQEYLKKYARHNASWADLIGILGAHSKVSLAKWSKVWVEEAGRPEIRLLGSNDKLLVAQSDPQNKGRVWIEKFKLMQGSLDKNTSEEILMNKPETTISTKKSGNFQILNSDGSGYGFFRLNAESENFLFQHINEFTPPILRLVSWSELWDEFYETKLHAAEIEKAAFLSLDNEQNEIIVAASVGSFVDVYYKFLTPAFRNEIRTKWQEKLWSKLDGASSRELKTLYWRYYVSLSEKSSGADQIEKVWKHKIQIPDLPFTETDEVNMAHSLAIRIPERADEILKLEEGRIVNPDRKAEFAFTRPAYSGDEKVRREFFFSLKNPENRRKEIWVLDALQSIGHVQRLNTAFMVKPALEWLKEIQRANDIFFPGSWLSAIFGNRSDLESATMVRDFLKDHPDFPTDLRQKILQSADMLFRASSSI